MGDGDQNLNSKNFPIQSLTIQVLPRYHASILQTMEFIKRPTLNKEPMPASLINY
jgi:hypothetical protein